MSIKRYLVKFYYIGLNKYHGSQRQSGYESIEGRFLEALEEKKYIHDTREANFDFASRTDRRVSARGASVAFDTIKKPILMEINSALPREIGAWSIAIIPKDFSARYNAIQRHYKYILPEAYSYLLNQQGLKLELMKEACRIIEGTHDFVNFSKRGKEETRTIRTMDMAKILIKDDHLIFEFKSQGFLRQQIRRTVKKLMEVGMNQISLADFNGLFDTSEYISYEPADPSGLILWDVYYGEEVKFINDKKSCERMEKYFLSQKLEHDLKRVLFKCLLEEE